MLEENVCDRKFSNSKMVRIKPITLPRRNVAFGICTVRLKLGRCLFSQNVKELHDPLQALTAHMLPHSSSPLRMWPLLQQLAT